VKLLSIQYTFEASLKCTESR